jgi:hypothetical protein
MPDTSSHDTRANKVAIWIAIGISLLALLVGAISLYESCQQSEWERTQGKLISVEGYYKTIDERVQGAKENGYDVGELERKLADADDRIASARTSWQNNQLDDANKLISESDSIIDSVRKELKQLLPQPEMGAAMHRWILLVTSVTAALLILFVFVRRRRQRSSG